MTFKQTMTIHKPTLQDSCLGFSPSGFLARIKNALKIEIPVGYQDETGFHTGTKPAEKEVDWPTNW
jgi:hypothetical protein